MAACGWSLSPCQVLLEAAKRWEKGLRPRTAPLCATYMTYNTKNHGIRGMKRCRKLWKPMENAPRLGSPLKSLALDLRGNVTELYARSAEAYFMLFGANLSGVEWISKGSEAFCDCTYRSYRTHLTCLGYVGWIVVFVAVFLFFPFKIL